MGAGLLKNIGIVTTAVTSISILLSIIYNSVFFSLFNNDLLFNLTLSDHIVTSIRFLPSVAFGLVMYLYLILCFKDSVRLLKIGIPKKFKDYFDKEDIQLSISLIFFLSAILFIITWMFLGTSGSPYLYIILWLFLGEILLGNAQDLFAITLSASERFLLKAFIFLCLIASIQGYDHARNYLENPVQVSVLTEVGEREDYNYIRQLSNGLAVYKDGKTIVINNESIASIDLEKNHFVPVSLGCKYFKICF